MEQLVNANQADSPVTRLCEHLGLSTSGFYAWLKRQPSDRDREDQTEVLRFTLNWGYGSAGLSPHAGRDHGQTVIAGV